VYLTTLCALQRLLRISQTGLDYLRFGPDNRISFILSFTMRPYSNIRGDEAPRNDRVD
jgi:hypothetical protein